MIDPSIFPVEHLDLDRLHANLVESQETVELLELVIKQDDPAGTMPLAERVHYDQRLRQEKDQVKLLKELIRRKRAALENA